jgi:hypothetical protein
MQVNRTHNAPNTLNMLFPPTGEQAHAGQSGQAVPVAPLARGPAKADPAAKPHTPAPPAAGVVLKLSTPTEEKPEKSIYSKGSLFGAPKIDLGSMTLQSQLALGQRQGRVYQNHLEPRRRVAGEPRCAAKPQLTRVCGVCSHRHARLPRRHCLAERANPRGQAVCRLLCRRAAQPGAGGGQIQSVCLRLAGHPVPKKPRWRSDATVLAISKTPECWGLESVKCNLPGLSEFLYRCILQVKPPKARLQATPRRIS